MKDQEMEQEEVRQQELRRKQRESAQLKTEKQEKLERFIHRVTWYLSMPIALFAIVLVLDGLLPATILNENIVRSFQEQPTDKRHNNHLRSFIETDHYQIPVPEDVTLDLSDKNDSKPTIAVYVTRFFKIPVEFTLSDISTEVLEVPRTIHTMGFPLKWILLISSLLTLFMKDFTKFSYALCFLPALLVAIILLIM